MEDAVPIVRSFQPLRDSATVEGLLANSTQAGRRAQGAGGSCLIVHEDLVEVMLATREEARVIAVAHRGHRPIDEGHRAVRRSRVVLLLRQAVVQAMPLRRCWRWIGSLDHPEEVPISLPVRPVSVAPRTSATP